MSGLLIPVAELIGGGGTKVLGGACEKLLYAEEMAGGGTEKGICPGVPPIGGGGIEPN